MDDLKNEFAAAAAALEDGDRARARTMLDRIIARRPDCHEAYFLRARASAELGEPGESEGAIRKALELNPDNPVYLRLLADVLVRQRRVIEAAEAVEQVLRLSEPTAALWSELANLRLLARQPEPAEAAFRRAIEADPVAEQSWSGLIISLVGQGRADAALREARAFVERCPASAEAHARLAMLLEQRGDLEEALRNAERAVGLDESHGLACFMLGTILFKQGKHEPARAALQRSLDHAVQSTDRQAVSRMLGRTLEALEAHDEAFERFAEARPSAASLSPDVVRMADDFRRYLSASRVELTAWSVASWGEAPKYLAFSTPPVFIVGLPYSGSAVLTRMLDSAGPFVVGEEFPAMAKLREHLQRHAGGIERVPVYLGQLGEAEIRLLRAMYFSEIERMLKGADPIGKRLIDRNPINLAHLSIVRRLFPDAPVIVCLRDPRDAAMSTFINHSRMPNAVVNFAELPEGCAFLADLMGVWEHFREVLGMRVCEVRYERLVESPEEEVGRVMSFLGEDRKPSALQSAAFPPLKAAGIGRWRRYRDRFGAGLEALSPFVERMGYEPDRG